MEQDPSPEGSAPPPRPAEAEREWLLAEARRARSSAEASEERYRLLAEAMPQIVWTARPDGGIDYYNRKWFEYTGVGFEQAQGWGWQAALHPDDLQAALERWEHSVRTGDPFEVQYRFRRASDGAYRWHLGRALPGRDHGGRIIKWFGTSTDIDDQKRAEERAAFLAEASTALGASLDYEGTLANLTHLAVPEIADCCVVDLVDENGGLRRLAIADVELARLERLWELEKVHPVGAREGAIPATVRTGHGLRLESLTEEVLAQVTGEGGPPEALRAFGFRSAMIVPLVVRGRCAGAVFLATAESQRIYAEPDLVFAETLAARAAIAAENARLYREAREANRVKDEFLATLSHELRTPLNAIVGWVHVLRGPNADAAILARGLETIDRNVKVQAQLIADLLDVSRIISGKLRLNPREVDLRAIVEAALETVRASAEAKGLRLVTRLEPEAEKASGDADRLQQVVWNLLSNAVRFTPSGGRIEVELAAEASSVRIVVRDTGGGIKPDFLPHVFERFRQADSSSTRSHRGLGLGLAIVRHLVELHGGTVQAESPGPGLGATFTVRLPRLAPKVDATALVPVGVRGALPAAASPPLEGLKVLVVDDDTDARDLMKWVLEQRGARVVAADSAAAAMAAFLQQRPDVLLSDLEMPGEDGFSLIRRIRALAPEEGGGVPAAALTGYAREEDRARALDAGYHRHLAKPVPPDELAESVRALARSRS